MSRMMVPVVLSGGSGSRLWPLSREVYPKQLHALIGENTMLQETVLRLRDIPELSAPLIICNTEHRFMVAEQLRNISVDPAAIILEPCGRNTAPAAAVGALAAMKHGEDPLLFVLPSDSVIEDREAFRQAFLTGAKAADQGNLVTFGVKPVNPNTGYGYIKLGAALPGAGEVFHVDRFVEKPDLQTAEEFVSRGGYLWNSGMFVFRSSGYLDELGRFAPDMLNACTAAVNKAFADLDFLRLDGAEYSACPSDSIDYAVMEHTEKACVVPLDTGWNDVGSWTSLWEASGRDGQGNVLRGDIEVQDVQDSFLYSSNRLVTGVGLRGVAVVETTDAVMVADMSRTQEIKDLVVKLKSRKREEVVSHRRVYRPWGFYETVDLGERFQVKRLMIKPGSILSLQKHYHRSEHWVVVRGTARVTTEGKTFVLHEDESTYIPVGATHRLENSGKIPLEIIEVQTGSYLGEDDIERMEDVYGRLEEGGK